MTGVIRPFRRSDRDQVTALVNAHAQAVVPGAGRITSDTGWADIGNSHVDPARCRRGIGTRLLAEVGDWLRLARIPCLLDYATADEAGHRAFLEKHNFRLLTRTHREWDLLT